MADAVAADNAAASEFGRLFARYASQFGLSEKDRKTSGPRYKIGKWAEVAGSIE